MRFFNKKRRTYGDINPDEIFLDSANALEFDRHQLEGRFETPIQKRTIVIVALCSLFVLMVFGGRIWSLQIAEGEVYTTRSENNRLRHSLVFSSRGVVYDRNGKELIWNENNEEEESYAKRSYTEKKGLAHVLGYVSYPQKDSSGIFYETEYVGKEGIEKTLSDSIGGTNGLKIVETNAINEIVSESQLYPPQNGNNVKLSIDAELTSLLYTRIENLARERGFKGGAGIIMDIYTGEIIALTSFPEFNSSMMASGKDAEAIKDAFNDPRAPFLNRATTGLYTPGSIVKPFVALAALNEGVISPEKEILSTGELRVSHPYQEGEYTVFKDWKAHGLVDLRDALAVSSNVYFFTVGGGHGSQKGVGISNIERYAKAFGIGQYSHIKELEEEEGTIPNPEWKAEHFNGEPWRLGDTYNTSIGQYGFQVTPLQMVRAVGAIATGGYLTTPTLIATEKNNQIPVSINVRKEVYTAVQEGMRQGAVSGTAVGLSVPGIRVAAKTGTAELGIEKSEVNSWVTGYFPYNNPRYAFVVVMERGSRSNLVGATSVMRGIFEWMRDNRSLYLEN